MDIARCFTDESTVRQSDARNALKTMYKRHTKEDEEESYQTDSIGVAASDTHHLDIIYSQMPCTNFKCLGLIGSFRRT